MSAIDLTVNGARRRLETDPQRSLLTVLREDLDLTGTKYGCGEGQCGACTVLVDGQPARSCLTRLGAVAGKAITTIEGLAAAERFGWGKARSTPERGFGLACGVEKGGYVATCAEIAAASPGGQVKVTRAVTAFECGAIVNPDHLKNQVEGSVIMGLGGALFEAVRFDAGEVENARFSLYRVPRFSDAPSSRPCSSTVRTSRRRERARLRSSGSRPRSRTRCSRGRGSAAAAFPSRPAESVPTPRT